PDLPLTLDRVVLRALQRDRDTRFPTAASFAAAIEEALKPASVREVAALVMERCGDVITTRRARVAMALKAPSPSSSSSSSGSSSSSPRSSADDVMTAAADKDGTGKSLGSSREIAEPSSPRTHRTFVVSQSVVLGVLAIITVLVVGLV